MHLSSPTQAILFFLIASFAAGCTPPADAIDIKDAWARPPAGASQGDHDQHSGDNSPGIRTAVYLTIQNNSGRSERLIGASTPAADTVEIHWSWIDEKGIMRMRPAETLEVLPAQTLLFEPGSYHLMLIGVQPLQLGDTLQLTLEFDPSGSKNVPVVIANQDQ